MRIDNENSKHLIADEGKVLCRISDGWIPGTEVHIGYIYYLDGKKLDIPIQELPEHYEDIDEPITEDTIILSEDVSILPLSAPMTLQEITLEDSEEITMLKRVTLSDYIELKKTVDQLKRIIGEHIQWQD